MDIYRELYPKVRPGITGPYKCKPSRWGILYYPCTAVVVVVVTWWLLEVVRVVLS